MVGGQGGGVVGGGGLGGGWSGPILCAGTPRQGRDPLSVIPQAGG